MEFREELLRIIEKNSRMNTKELAVILGVAEDVVAEELKTLEDEGTICGYHTMVNWENVSTETVTALIEVKVTPQRGQGFDNIAERIYNYPEVESVVSGFVSEKLSGLETVTGTATHFILKKYKDHGTVLGKKKEDTREIVTP